MGFSEARKEEIKKNTIGQHRINRNGIGATCIEYKNSKDIMIKFDNIDLTRKSRWDHFNKGQFDYPIDYIRINEKIGQERINAYGFKAKCINYNNSSDITIQLEDGSIINNISWGNFNKGVFKANKNSYGGDLGVKPKFISSGKPNREYETWTSMLKRCYSKSVKTNRKSYEKCSVCNAWMNYDNFYDWLHKQDNYKIWYKNNGKWCLDKDILIKGNNIYKPDACTLVPNNINCLIINCTKHRGEYPIGVYLDKTSGLFRAQCENPKYGRQIGLGYFEDKITAFNAYKIYKEKLIKDIAEDAYKLKQITKECYEALLNYKVEITD